MSTEKGRRGGVSSSEETSRFYNRLMRGDVQRGILGKGSRYAPLRLAHKDSVVTYFDGFVKKFIGPDDVVLDFGCGPGTFSIRTAQYCKSIVGVDITEEFVRESERAFAAVGLANATAVHVPPHRLPFESDSFDAVVMVDVVHHLDDIHASLDEVMRVLKPGGKVIVFEPNKLNPLIWLIHYFDKNERGLLALGTPWVYRRIFARYASAFQYEFNGIVIGPQSKLFDLISAVINHKALYPLLGWLNPKIACYAEAHGSR